MNGLFLGVDVGLGGAIGAVDHDGRLAMVEDLPLLARGNGRVKHELDTAGLARLLRPHVAEIRIAVVESVASRPRQGLASTFSLGHSYGTVVAVLQALGVPVCLVSPASWKSTLGYRPTRALRGRSRPGCGPPPRWTRCGTTTGPRAYCWPITAGGGQ